MKLIDLTHTLTQQMSVFPGAPQPRLEARCDPQSGSRETSLVLNSHHGTHVVAPYHLLPQGKSLDKLDINQFFGLALMVEVSSCAGGEIPLELLQAKEEELKCCEFLVLKSGWDRKWGQPGYLQGFPVLSQAAADYLAGFEFLQGVGLDMPSPDPTDSRECPVHRTLLAGGKLIIENLCNLDSIQGQNFLLSCLPLKYGQADGSPVRAAAFQAPAGIYYPS